MGSPPPFSHTFLTYMCSPIHSSFILSMQLGHTPILTARCVCECGTCCVHFLVAAQRFYRCVDGFFLFIIVIPYCSHVLPRTIVVWVVFFPKLVQELFVCDFPGIKLGVSLFVKNSISIFIYFYFYCYKHSNPYESYVNHERFSVPYGWECMGREVLTTQQ